VIHSYSTFSGRKPEKKKKAPEKEPQEVEDKELRRRVAGRHFHTAHLPIFIFDITISKNAPPGATG
jgi:hypothetical protein